MPKPELWQGERDQRWQIMERMEEDRAERERHARKSGASGTEANADYQQRLAEQGLTAPAPGDHNADARLADEIYRLIEAEGHLAASGIVVEVTNCEVTLTGTAANPEACQRARELAEQVPGVARTVSRLQIL